MKIYIDRIQLLEAVTTVGKASIASFLKESPELSGILFEASSDKRRLKLTSTNKEFSIQRVLEGVKVFESGSAVIPAALIHNILSCPNEDYAEIEIGKNNRVKIQIGRTHYEINALPAEKFPKAPIPFPATTIKAKGLPALIRRAIIASGRDAEQPEKQCVKLVFSKLSSTATATDSYRISISEAEECADGSLEILLHMKALTTLSSIVGRADEVFVGVNDKWAIMFKEGLIFSARIMESNFVDSKLYFERFKHIYECTVSGSEFLSGADIVSLCSMGCINLAIIENGICLSSESEKNTSKVHVSGKVAEQTPPEGFYYNPKYILDVLKIAKGEIVVRLDKIGIMLLEASGIKYFVMPMKKPIITTKEKKKPKTKKSTAGKAA